MRSDICFPNAMRVYIYKETSLTVKSNNSGFWNTDAVLLIGPYRLLVLFLSHHRSHLWLECMKNSDDHEGNLQHQKDRDDHSSHRGDPV